MAKTENNELELQKEPDDGSNAESGSSNPVTKPKPRAWKKRGNRQTGGDYGWLYKNSQEGNFFRIFTRRIV